MDIFRTLAHELVHHQQREHGRIEDPHRDGKTGSPIEDEANYMAGRLMRQWGKKNPKMFGMEALNEACWKGYHQPKKQKLKPKEGAPGRFVPNCVPNKNAKTKVEETVKITKMDSKFSRFLESTPSDREWGKPSLTKIFKEATPGQSCGCKEGQQNEENCTCSQAQKGKSPVVPDDIQGGSRFPTSPLFEKKKFVRKKVLDEDGVLDTASGAVGLPQSDSIGAEFGVAKSPSLIGGLVGVSSPVAGMGPAGSLYPYGTYGIAEEKTGKSLSKLKENWESIADRESTPIGKSHVEVKEENDKVVDLEKKRDEKKTNEFAKGLAAKVKERVAAQSELVKKYKDDGKFEFEVGDRFSTPFTRERKEPPYKVVGHYVDVDRKGVKPPKHGYYVQRKYGKGDEDVEKHKITIPGYSEGFQKIEPLKSIKEESPAWQRKEGKNPEGGLNKKGVASYRREHPGSKLQTAVTTKPSKLNPDSKAAKRRKSFCARMSGMPGPMKDEKGRPTRKALSLRKWNCE
jgi:hypothetical protein